MDEVKKTVVVTGANGFLGQVLVREFLKNGWIVRAFVRKESIWPFVENPKLERWAGDMRDESSLHSVCTGATGVVHAAAKKSDEVDSEDVNVGGAKNLVSAALKSNIDWIINISTQSSKLLGAGVYGQTKKRSDEILSSSGIPLATLRLSLVYGPGSSGVFQKITRIAQLPLTPILGKGNIPFRPIYVDDVADAVMRAINHVSCRGDIYDVGGPEEVTLVELLQKIKSYHRIHTPVVHLPIGFMLFIARILSVLPHPPITVSNVRGGVERVVMDTHPFNSMTGFHPRKIDEGLRATFDETYEEKEARSLLSYCMHPAGIRWNPTSRDVSHYCRALVVHGIENHRVDDTALSSFQRLMALECACIVKRGSPVLRRKIAIAAALVETNPASALWLLPANRSYASIILDGCTTILRLLLIVPRTIFYLLSPSFLQRNAGY